MHGDGFTGLPQGGVQQFLPVTQLFLLPQCHPCSALPALPLSPWRSADACMKLKALGLPLGAGTHTTHPVARTFAMQHTLQFEVH